MTVLRSALMLLVLVVCGVALAGPVQAEPKRPNVLMIAVDDLNHWVGHLKRHPQAHTPNIDRLAAGGVSFSRAYCASPACLPSRAALMGGRRPSTTGIDDNKHKWQNKQAPGEGLSAQFLRAGYHVAGAGKIYHRGDHYDQEWSEYMSTKGLSWNGPGVDKLDGYFVPLEVDLKDDDLMDWHSVNYCIERMRRDDDKPFFLACGLYKPHLSFAAPRKYYEHLPPMEDIKLPPYLDNDLDDIPRRGRAFARTADHQRFEKEGTWRRPIRSYLATCTYTDMNVGRLLDALQASGKLDDTIIVLWGDHGWSFGEKRHWRKFALWEEPTRTPMIWVVPGTTPKGVICDTPVDLMSVYPTLMEAAGLPKPDHVEGHDLAPLLKDVDAEWDHPAITTFKGNNHAVRKGPWRYIRYSDGSEELYDHRDDPYEWHNLAGDAKYDQVKAALKADLP